MEDLHEEQDLQPHEERAETEHEYFSSRSFFPVIVNVVSDDNPDYEHERANIEEDEGVEDVLVKSSLNKLVELFDAKVNHEEDQDDLGNNNSLRKEFFPPDRVSNFGLNSLLFFNISLNSLLGLQNESIIVLRDLPVDQDVSVEVVSEQEASVRNQQELDSVVSYRLKQIVDQQSDWLSVEQVKVAG